VDDAGDVGELIARTRGEGLVGTVGDGPSDELRDRLTCDGSRSLQLLVELRIEAEASHKPNRITMSDNRNTLPGCRTAAADSGEPPNYPA
jgi:hypothetical protein